MVAWKLQKAIAGTASKDAPRSGTATVQRRDSNGTVWVRLPGASMDTPVVGSVVASVAAGDTISYEIQGGRVNVTGNASDPAAGERAVGAVRKAANAARGLARDAKAIAEATGQYFWRDDSGAHVSTEKNNPAGPQNTIWNSLGMLFRSGTTNLLAIVAGADSGMDVYDGQGNDEDNIIASHRGSGTRIGRSSENNMLITPHNIRSYDEYQRELFRVGKNVEADGYKPTQETWTIETAGTDSVDICVWEHNVGNVKGYKRNSTDVIDPLTITLNGTEIAPEHYTVEYSVSISQDWAHITFDGTVTTNVDDTLVVAYRSNFVGMSMHFGPYSESDGNGAVALGHDTFALGVGCHATGVGTSATGSGTSASGGYYAQDGDFYVGIDGGKASGRGCSASGIATVAKGEGQAVFGRANVPDNYGTYAFIVGNGHINTFDGVVDSYSNAFAIRWNGVVEHYGDVPWTTFPVSSAASHYNSSKPLRYRKWGQMVNLMGAVTPNADVQAGQSYSLTIGTLPVGCRPQEELTQLCQGSGTASWMLRITTGGVVTAERYRTGSGYAVMPAPSGGSSGAWLTMNCTFIV